MDRPQFHTVLGLLVALFFSLPVRPQEFNLNLNLDQNGRSATYTKGQDLLKAMQKRYKGKWCKRLSFVQRTERYRNDSLVNVATWYEAMMFPDKFRIDFGLPEEGNAIIFRKDSAYHFGKGVLLRAEADTNALLLLLGGLYFRDLKSVVTRLNQEHFNTDKLQNLQWQGRVTYVLGDTLSNQVWIDQEQLRVVRIIEHPKRNETRDTRIDAYQPSCGGFIETKVSFYRNGRLLQVEYYSQISSDPILKEELFQPKQFGKGHWYKSVEKK